MASRTSMSSVFEEEERRIMEEMRRRQIDEMKRRMLAGGSFINPFDSYVPGAGLKPAPPLRERRPGELTNKMLN
jgi:hypothetical protein